MANGSDIIIVDGVKMTIKEFRTSIAEKQKAKKGKSASKPKKAVKKEKEISLLAIEIEKMLKPMTTLKSVQVYKNHAYRSWGTIANEILAHKGISRPMAEYCVRLGELNKLVSDIQEMASKNEKAAYQYVEKMAWKLDDMKQDIVSIIKGVENSGVCERYKNHEAIYGKGRQLGLQTVVTKCLDTISQIEDVIGALKKIADEGVDPFEYGTHMTAKTRARCWA